MGWIIDKNYRSDKSLIVTPFFESLRCIATKLNISFQELDSILAKLDLDEEDIFWEASKEYKLEQIQTLLVMKQEQANIIIEHMITLEQNDQSNPVLQVLGDLVEEFEFTIPGMKEWEEESNQIYKKYLSDGNVNI